MLLLRLLFILLSCIVAGNEGLGRGVGLATRDSPAEPLVNEAADEDDGCCGGGEDEDEGDGSHGDGGSGQGGGGQG